MRVLFLIVCFLGFAPMTEARTYYCDLTEALSLGDEGELERHPLEEELLEYKMVIDDETGRTFHPQFGNAAYSYAEVLDRGSSTSSLKIIAYSEEGNAPELGGVTFRNAVYAEIKTFAAGATKPMIVLSGGDLGIGVCK